MSTPSYFPGPALGRIYLAPEGNAGGVATGAGATGGNVTGAQSGGAQGGTVDASMIARLVGENKGINLDQSIRLGDKALTIADLIKNHTDAEALRSQVAESSKAVEALKVLYGRETPKEEVARPHMERAFLLAGYSADEAKSKVDELLKAAKGGTAAPEKEIEDDDSAETGMRDDILRSQVDQFILDKVTSQSQIKDIKDIVDLVKRRDGDAEAAEIAKDIHERVLAGTKANLAKRVRDAIEQRRKGINVTQWDHRWVAEESDKVAKEVAARVRKYTGDPGKIGKTLGVVGGDAFSVLPEKPIEVPSGKEFVDKGVPKHKLEEALDQRTEDRLLRAVQASVLSGVGV